MAIFTNVSGYVCTEVEERVTSKGAKMKLFTVVPFGKNKENPFVKCMVMGDHLDGILQYVKKGTHLVVGGQLQPPEVYTSKTGEPKVSMKVFVGSIGLIPRGEKRTSETSVKSEPMVWEDQLTAGGAASVSEDLPF